MFVFCAYQNTNDSDDSLESDWEAVHAEKQWLFKIKFINTNIANNVTKCLWYKSLLEKVGQ